MRYRYAFVGLCACLGLSQGAAAKENSDSKVTEIYEQAIESETLPGITVAVADKSGIRYARGFGFADLENKVSMTPRHKVRIGSVSKLVATAGMMRLVEQGKIDLDAPVRNYAPAWPEEKPRITLRQLAAHTAGIRHYKEGADEFLLNQQFDDINSALALFKNDPLLFKPGDEHNYSTFGWTLVSAAMEGADGKRTFREIINQEVFTPLKLNEMVFDDQYSIIPHRARPYIVENDVIYNAPQTDHSYKWAGGGFIATPSDVARFAVAHLNDDYLQSETVQQMFTPATLNNGESVPFGIGWMVGFERYKNRKEYKDNTKALALMSQIPNAVMHSGGSMGGITMLILCRDHQRAVTVVKNVSGEEETDVFILALKTLAHYHQQSDKH